MANDKGKKPKVETTEHIDEQLVLNLDKLQQIQDELEKINEEVSEKVLEIEQKYNKIRKPVYERRDEISRAMPDFWLTAFLCHPALSDLLSAEDQKIFKHLISLEVEDFEDVKSGYFITFIFSPNPYFEDEKLTKTFNFHEDGTTKTTATTIKWKEGKGVPNGVDNEKNDGSKRPHEEQSFFCWFAETQETNKTDEVVNDEIGEIIKEDLWPNPIAYFVQDDAVEVDGGVEEVTGLEDDIDQDGEGN